MQIHSLELADDFSLIGIHSSEEDYRLAFLLNQYLQTKFSKLKQQLDFHNTKASFSVFEFIDERCQLSYHLIANKFIGNAYLSAEPNLFSTENTFSNISYLIREKKTVDFFLKIEGDISHYELKKRIDQIKNINQVITSYKIDPKDLKSKDHLIF
jgi:hypothetical protein